MTVSKHFLPVEDVSVVEDRMIKDIGPQPREGIGDLLDRQRLPTQLQAEAGVVQAANSQCELQAAGNTHFLPCTTSS